MKLKDFLKQDADLDVESSLTDDWAMGFVGPVNLTEEVEATFASILDNEVTEHGCVAVIEVADEKQDKLAYKLFKCAAGYCTCETYDKLFKEVA